MASTSVTITTTGPGGTQIVTAPPVIVTTIYTTGENGSTTKVVVTIHNPTGTLSPSGGGHSPTEQFFSNRGAVAAVFTIVGLAVVAIAGGLWYAWRRHRTRQRLQRDAALAAGVPVPQPVLPLPDDDDEAAMIAHRRRTVGDLEADADSPRTAFLGLPLAASMSGHGHPDSGEGETYEPYSGYGQRPLSMFASTMPPDYVPARTQSTSPRPASPGYATMLPAAGASSIGHSGGSSSDHNHSSSHGHTWFHPHPYSAGRPITPPAQDSPPTSDQHHEPQAQPLTPPSSYPPKVPSRHPSRGGSAMKIAMPPPPALVSPPDDPTSASHPYQTASSEFPPSSYSLYPPSHGSDEGRLDPNIAQRLRGGAPLTNASTQSFRDDQDYSRRITMHTYDSYTSVPSDVPESESAETHRQ
ncbi:hypothetical protein EXIGLDRAFT_468975 [Exidia glandulosa HHB12029]|uniref:Uncharacterized protein n=1 Tax=Exidia glandulosa HHB12029 TaxID=1314781 RepID=A0A166AVR8_EXIGL|nr:hypothetical protein EXIGLDRAFT_468975 [Exidia glandulosa HHB12029]